MTYTNTVISSNAHINNTLHFKNQNTNISDKEINTSNENTILNISSKAKNIIKLTQSINQLDNMFSSTKKLNGIEKVELNEAEHKIYDILDEYRNPREREEATSLFKEHVKLNNGGKLAFSDEELLESLMNWSSYKSKPKDANIENQLKEIWNKFLEVSSLYYISSSDRAMSYKVSKEIDKVIENNNITPEYKEKLIELQKEANSRYQHGDYEKVNMPEYTQMKLEDLFDKVSKIYDLPEVDNEYLAKASELVFENNKILKAVRDDVGQDNKVPEVLYRNVIRYNPFGNGRLG